MEPLEADKHQVAYWFHFNFPFDPPCGGTWLVECCTYRERFSSRLGCHPNI